MKQGIKIIYLPAITFFLFTALSSLEILAFFKQEIFSIVAGRVWLTWGLVTLLYCLFLIGKQLVLDFKKRSFLSIFALIFITVLLSFRLQDFPQYLSGETSQQIVSGLENWQKPDFDYTKTAYLGFPSRQYLFISLPTLISGISVTSYRIGYLLIFLLGIFVFYAGTKIYYEKSADNDKYIALSLLAIPSFPGVQLLSRLFDMPILPPAFFLITIGLLLIAYRTESFFAFFALAWSITMLVNTYTPALSAWALVTLFILAIGLRFLIKQKSIKLKILSSLPWLSVCLLSICFAIISFVSRTDLRISHEGKIAVSENISKIYEVFDYTFIRNFNMWNNQLQFLGQLLLLPVLIFLIGSLFYFWGLHYLAISAWTVVSIALAGISNGYSNPPVENSMYRLLIIIPALIWGILDLIFKSKPVISARVYSLLVAIFCLYSLSISLEINSAWQNNPDYRHLVLRKTLKIANEFNLPKSEKIQLGALTSRPEIQFMHEHLPYFFPYNQVFDSQESCLADFNQKHNMVIFYDNKSCAYDYLENNPNFRKFNYDLPPQIQGIKIGVYKKTNQ